MRAPDWASGWRIDQVIECLPLGTGDSRRAVERDLMAACPEAYEGEEYPEGTPMTEAGTPEYPDAEPIKPRTLDRFWAKLSEETQTAIVVAYQKEFPNTPRIFSDLMG